MADAISWWHCHGDKYPRLSVMALDYLSIPGKLHIRYNAVANTMLATLVDVEHIFSQARILMPHTRNCLDVPTIRSLMCLGSWGAAGFICDAEALAVIEEHAAAKGKQKVAAEWDGE
jgi:hypothetical protein